MTQARRALIFVGQSGADIALINALEELRIPKMWPWEQADHAAEVAIIVIDRPAVNALKICSNLRSQAKFKTRPMLIILDPADSGSLAQFSFFDADVLTRPLRYEVVHRYISSKLSTSFNTNLETSSLTLDAHEKETELIGIDRKRDAEAD